jgi:membrane protein implicated in regulation of membrane protease activity
MLFSSFFKPLSERLYHEVKQAKTSLPRTAIVTTEIPAFCTGRAKFKGTYYKAACPLAINIQAETVVNVIEIQGVTLIVEPLNKSALNL